MPGACPSPLDKFDAIQMCLASGAAEKKAVFAHRWREDLTSCCRRNAALSRRPRVSSPVAPAIFFLWHAIFRSSSLKCWIVLPGLWRGCGFSFRDSSLSRSQVKITGSQSKHVGESWPCLQAQGWQAVSSLPAPVRVDHMIGKSSAITVDTAMILGRNRNSASSITASRRA